MEMKMLGRDVWVKHTDKDGKSFVMYHRAWDVGLMMETLQKEATKNGGSVEQVMNPKELH